MSQQDPQPLLALSRLLSQPHATNSALRLYPALSYDVAYNGGCSLRIRGYSNNDNKSNTNSNNNNYSAYQPLFATNIPVSSSLYVEFISQADLGSLVSLSVRLQHPQSNHTKELILSDSEELSVAASEVVLPSSQDLRASKWRQRTYHATADRCVGWIVTEIGVRCAVDSSFVSQTANTTDESSPDFSAYIGQLSLSQSPLPTLTNAPAIGVTATPQWDISSSLGTQNLHNITLTWSSPQHPHPIRHYDVYREGKWIGRTFTNMFIVQKHPQSLPPVFAVQPVDYFFHKLAAAEARVTW